MAKLLEFDDFEQAQQDRERQLEEPKVEKARAFIYTVHEHDAENDKFHADVRDTDGNVVWELKKDEFPNEDELEEFDRQQSEENATPRMRDIDDLIGLRKLLIHKGVMKQEDTLKSNEEYAEDIVDRPTQVVNLNLIENKTNMKVFDFDKFLAESEGIQENAQGSGNKFILNRFSTGAPNPAVTKFFQQHATGRPIAAKTPTGWMTIFETSLTKEALIQGFDALGITYDLYQVVHTGNGGTPNAQSASEPSASVEDLKKKLKKALAADEFEVAARLRDEIAQREGRAVGAPGIGNEMGESEKIGDAIMAFENTKAFPEIHAQMKAQLHKMLSEGLNLDSI